MPSKNLLTPVNRRRYSRGVAETTATGFGDLLLHTADDHRQVVFLHPQPLRVLFNGRQWWGCLRACRFPYAPVRQPCYLPLTRLATGSGVTTAYGGRTMLSHTTARSEQEYLPNSLTSIVAEALRGAALAPTVGEALDVAGAALCSIATIARADQPAMRGQCVNEPFCAARDAADQTMRVLDRVSYLFEAIARLACDADGAIEDLASVGRELVDAETDRIDRVFTRLAHQALSVEVQHG